MIQAAIALLCALQAAPQSDAGDWSQWRGPSRDGRFEGPSWKEGLSQEHLSVSWRVDELGPSYSGPVVDSKRVYTTATEGEREEVVRAFDRKTGELLWRSAWEGAMKVPFFAARNGSWIRATPACDGESLFVAGMRDVLACLEAETGELRWRVDFNERYGAGLPQFGMVCSPLLDGDFVYVQAGASFLKLDKRSGKTVWRSMVESGRSNEGSFSSPAFASLHGRRQILVQSRKRLAGIAPEDGSELWSTPVEAFRDMNILTPLAFGDSVFTSTYGGRSKLFSVARTDGVYAVNEDWENRAQGYMTSPVLIDGHAYLFLRSNRFACVDLYSGEERWISPPTGDTYWSLAAQGDRILALSDSGTLRLLRANPRAFDVLSERELDEGETWAHLAPSRNQLFVRGLSSLVAFEWQP